MNWRKEVNEEGRMRRGVSEVRGRDWIILKRMQ